MKTKHTPGPWKCDERSGCVGVYEKSRDVNCFSGVEESFVHFKMYDKNENGEWVENGEIANARLIAAAPEMLEALIFMMRLGYTCDKMTIAVEKATGQTIEELTGLGE
jgi:hypothetical protein